MKKIKESTAVLLCGGLSRRMGFDKAFLPMGEGYLLKYQVDKLQEIFQTVILITDKKEKLNILNLPSNIGIYEDLYPKTGPLGGICTAMHHAKTDWAFVMACDMPDINLDVIGALWERHEGSQITLCKHGDKEEPLFAFYHNECQLAFTEQILSGNYKIRDNYSKFNINTLEIPSKKVDDVFSNLNTPEELSKYTCKHRVLHHVVQVGAFGSDDGKTSVACDVIQKIGEKAPVIGVKIVCVDPNHSGCHKHSGAGCGVCDTLAEHYEWMKETEDTGAKDTIKMKQSGAKVSYLLRCKEPYLRDAFFKFIKQEVPEGTIVVCESNRLRLYATPGVFLFVAREWPYQGEKKPHADQLAALADGVIVRGDPLPDWDVTTDELGHIHIQMTK